MKFDINLEGLPPHKKELLKADLAYMKAEIKDEFMTTLDDMKNNRSMQGKILKTLKNWNGALMSGVSSIEATLEAMGAVDIITYKIADSETNTRVFLEINDIYFTVIDQLNRLNPFGRNSKKKFVTTLQKGVKKTYNCPLTFTEIKE